MNELADTIARHQSTGTICASNMVLPCPLDCLRSQVIDWLLLCTLSAEHQRQYPGFDGERIFAAVDVHGGNCGMPAAETHGKMKTRARPDTSK